MDVVDAATRSRMMAGIRGKDTLPEVSLRKALFGLGFRYRLHARDIPGRPDMAFPRWKAVILVHGCFWHGHDCHLFKWPKSRTQFWKEKIEGNRLRDIATVARLSSAWRCLTVWECALKGRSKRPLIDVAKDCAAWLTSRAGNAEIRGG